jgi:hypothetical protein
VFLIFFFSSLAQRRIIDLHFLIDQTSLFLLSHFTLEAKMANLFEQSINHNTRCFACGSLVYAVEKKMTTHHVCKNLPYWNN